MDTGCPAETTSLGAGASGVANQIVIPSCSKCILSPLLSSIRCRTHIFHQRSLGCQCPEFIIGLEPERLAHVYRCAQLSVTTALLSLIRKRNCSTTTNVASPSTFRHST